MNDALANERLIGDFHQGQAASRRGQYRSDCLHAPGTERYDAWMSGFEDEEGMPFVVSEAGEIAQRTWDALGKVHNPAMAEAFKRAGLT